MSQEFTYNPEVTAQCPFCKHTETFESNIVAQAWLCGHIQVDHSDELPPLEMEE